MTVEQLIRHCAGALSDAGVFFGHGTDNAIDEACWLVSATLGLAPDFGEAELGREVDEADRERVERLLAERIATRKPLAYLLGRAWVAGLEFEISEQVLVPRSPLAELVVEGFEPWLASERLLRAVDVGTGSGCLAVALACHWPGLRVDAVDVSPPALELARRNAARHGVADRVRVVESDLLDALAGNRYDLILANPPYVPSASMRALPPEYHHEPALGLEAGEDGLDLVRRLLVDVPDFLTEGGILVCEVGEAAEAVEALLGERVALTWLAFAHGGDGVFVLDAEGCRQAAAVVGRTDANAPDGGLQ